jgi:hypothetical protein
VYPFSVTITECQAFPSTVKVAVVVSHVVLSMQASAPVGTELTVILPGGTTAITGTARRRRNSTTRSVIPVCFSVILGCGGGRGIRFLGGLDVSSTFI